MIFYYTPYDWLLLRGVLAVNFLGVAIAVFAVLTLIALFNDRSRRN